MLMLLLLFEVLMRAENDVKVYDGIVQIIGALPIELEYSERL